MHWAITSLGDHLPSPYTGEIDSHAERHRQIVDLAVEAEHLGARSVPLGEHHFCDVRFSDIDFYDLSISPILHLQINSFTTTVSVTCPFAFLHSF